MSDALNAVSTLARPGLLARFARRASLSNSEEAILVLASRGLSREEIACARGVSPGTIKKQVASILSKTSAALSPSDLPRPRSLHQAVLLIFRHADLG